MADKEYFFQGYVGNAKAKPKDFEGYTLQELKNQMKTLAKRLNTRLATLEKENVWGSSYAHGVARKYAFDEAEFMRTGAEESPRFVTAVNKYDSNDMYERARTREEIIEQLVAMEHFESLTESTVSGMMSKYKAMYDYRKKHDKEYTLTFDEYISQIKSKAYDLIAKYYGYETADAVYDLHRADEESESENNAAVDAYVQEHPENFRKDNPLNSEGELLIQQYDSWYEDNWEDVKTTPEQDKSILDSI